MRALVNPAATTPARWLRRATTPRRFHATLPDYASDAVARPTDLARELGLGGVAIKDESDRLGLPAFKVLGASWAVERALRETPGTRQLVAASAGNHGRAVAHVAARPRTPLHRLPPRPRAAGPARRDRRRGRRGRVVDGTLRGRGGARGGRGRGGRDAARSPTSARRGPARWVVDGYATLFAEIAERGRVRPRDRPGRGGIPGRGGGPLRRAGGSMRDRRRARHRRVPHRFAGTRRACSRADAWHDDGRPRLRGGLGVRVAGAARRHTRHRYGRRRRGERRDGRARRRGAAIGESGAAPLAGLRVLVSDPDAAPLREAVDLGPGTRAVLIATEGPTGI